MFPDVMQGLKSYFGRDFLLGVFFPVLIFVSANLTLYIEITQGLAPSFAAWEKLSLGSQLLLVLGGLILVMVLSYLIYNFQYSITRLFEGYWPRMRLLDTLRNTRIELYKQRWKYLDTQKQSASASMRGNEIEAEQLTYYPPPSHLDKMMPTRIGNILRASELYAYDHYGIDSVIIWTRLRPLLPDEVVAPLADSKTASNFMLLMSVFSVTFTLIWCPVLALFTSRWELFLLCALGWPLAWICHHSAVQSELAYSEQLKAVFDLHRYDLLKALNRPIPLDDKAERKEWERLAQFFYRNIPIPPAPLESDKLQGLGQVVTALLEFLKKINPPTS